MRDEALDLAEHGWPVLPLKGKVPITAHGVDDATTDPATVRWWWSRWPTANIGARVPDSLLVLDVDPRNRGDLGALAGVLPQTLTVVSGRNDGGMHFYFRRPFGPITSGKLPRGFDLKLKGYCVVPPSLHPATGQPYRWLMHEPVPLPVWLREQLRPDPPKPRPVVRGSGSGRALVEFVASFVDDGVNNALYWAAARAAEDGILDEIADELVEVATRVGESHQRAKATVESARNAPPARRYGATS